ncbi:UBA-like domain-containing protein 2-A [Lineus longissimus]|uniref:UBA-like domain-containing protein 2-A n=1 Tax=Lineus longissimus TaxID=88925 RepID=UPI002B4C7E2C
MDQNLEILRQQLLITKLMDAACCNGDQAKKLLLATNWHFQAALSLFFQEAAIPSCRNCHGNHHNCHLKMCTPQNTPATPPNFPDALMAFSKMSTNEKHGTSPVSNPYHQAMPPPAQMSQSPTSQGIHIKP